jgi:hypothetical protein
MTEPTLNSQFLKLMAGLPLKAEERTKSGDFAVRHYYFSGARAVLTVLHEAHKLKDGGDPEGATRVLKQMANEVREYEHELHVRVRDLVTEALGDTLAEVIGAIVARAREKPDDSN